jgi:bifunctional non-homologous end joining protein LigD
VNPFFAVLPAGLERALKPGPLPDWIPPMLATLSERVFSNPQWIYEQKFDGERCITYRSGGRIRLSSRNRTLLNDTYPELVEAFGEQTAVDFIVDGEVVAFGGNIPKFSILQQRMGVSNPGEERKRDIPVYYYLFDLLFLDGYDLTDLPLLARKALLRDLFTFGGAIRFSQHRLGEGETCYRNACQKGLEGVIAKRADSRYIPRRSSEWLKFKCVKWQEFVIGGYTEPQKKRVGFGAILIGYYRGNTLVYAGKVGTGFDEAALQALYDAFRTLEQGENPFLELTEQKGVHFVRPVLVAEIGFTEWTDEGKLRHPRFFGIRSDMDPQKVVRLEPDRHLPAGQHDR